MMKQISVLLAVASAVLVFPSCTREPESGILDPANGDHFLSFRISYGGTATRSAAGEAGRPGGTILLGETEDGKELRLVETIFPAGLPIDTIRTKGTPITSENAGGIYGSFTAVAYSGTNRVTIGRESSFVFEYEGTTGKWGHLFSTDPWSGHSAGLTFFMSMPEMPEDISFNPSAGTLSFPYTSPSDAVDQKDLLFGARSFSNKTAHETDPTVTFLHALTGVRFELGNADNGTAITSVTLKNIVRKGSVVIKPASGTVSWTPDSEDLADYSLTEGPDFSDLSLAFWLVPQTLPDEAELEVTYTIAGGDNKTVSVIINEALGERAVWSPGELHVFTLNPDEVNVTITDEAGTSGIVNPVIRNTGNVMAYLRAVIVANWQDANGNILAAWDFDPEGFAGLPGDGWVLEDDGFYYTQERVMPGYEAPELFTTYTPTAEPPAGTHLVMDIAVQAVNEKPTSWAD